jgi:hypothetical protein
MMIHEPIISEKYISKTMKVKVRIIPSHKLPSLDILEKS